MWKHSIISVVKRLLLYQFNENVGYFDFYYTPKSENVLIIFLSLTLTKPLLNGPLPKMRLFVDYKDEKK